MADTTFAPELLNLPWQIQLSLASGYAAYLTSFRGIRASHTAVDITFSTLAFGLIATGMYAWRLPHNGVFLASITAFLTCFITGIIWRKAGRRIIGAMLKRIDVSWSDDDPSALATVLSNSRYPISQVGVLLEDGSWLLCENTEPFAKLPYGPCTFGPSGDIALYVSHTKNARGLKVATEHTVDGSYGSQLTLVPASKISRMTVRLGSKSTVVGRWWSWCRSWF